MSLNGALIEAKMSIENIQMSVLMPKLALVETKRIAVYERWIAREQNVTLYCNTKYANQYEIIS